VTGVGVVERAEAGREEEAERFLKKGILERMLEGCVAGGAEADDEVSDDASLTPDSDPSSEVSDPVLESSGAGLGSISPKYRSVSRTASACGTPANATTILSGL